VGLVVGARLEVAVPFGQVVLDEVGSERRLELGQLGLRMGGGEVVEDRAVAAF
jgi:hypothetical protein